MKPEDRQAAEAARGFMPPDEGLALHAAAVAALTAVGSAPMLEIGSYCGKSALYLGSAARDAGRVFAGVVDFIRRPIIDAGSEQRSSQQRQK